jgi:short-subunit dehydrogenase
MIDKWHIPLSSPGKQESSHVRLKRSRSRNRRHGRRWRALRRRIGRTGYDLLLVGRQQQALDAEAVAVAKKAKVKVDTLVANLAEPAELARVEARISRDPAISALINGATAVTFSPLATVNSEAVDETVAVNIMMKRHDSVTRR